MADEKFSNGLTLSEGERLYLLMEEMAEVTQIIGKILRHGYESYSPYDEAKITNRVLLERELGHAAHAVRLLMRAGDIQARIVDEFADEKALTVRQFLHFQGE